ncbi:hypothetical protein [Myxosarcina sp. GI1(2024)]
MDDAHSPKIALKLNGQKLVAYILSSQDSETYDRAQEIADSLAECERNIKAKEEEHAPIKAKYQEGRAELKKLKLAKQEEIETKVKELERALSIEDSEKIARYNADKEKEATKSKRQKQIKKSLKEVGKGFLAAELDGLTEEFGEAICQVNTITFNFWQKLRQQIQENKEPKINFDTEEGWKQVSQKYDRECKTHETNIINKTRLNPDWKDETDDEARVTPQLVSQSNEIEAVAA